MDYFFHEETKKLNCGLKAIKTPSHCAEMLLAVKYSNAI